MIWVLLPLRVEIPWSEGKRAQEIPEDHVYHGDTVDHVM